MRLAFLVYRAVKSVNGKPVLNPEIRKGVNMVHVAEDSRALAEDILSSARARQQGIADRKSEVAGLVAGTQRFLRDCEATQHTLQDKVIQAANALRQHLANSANARLEAFCQMHKRIAGRVAGLAREVRSKLEESHNDSLATRAVWNDLASARSAVKKTTRKR